MARNFLITIVLLIAAQNAFALNICSPTANQTSTVTSNTFFDSGGAGSNYGNGQNCSLLIQPVGGGTITLAFTAFETRNNQDSLTIYNGADNTAPVLGTFFGNLGTPFNVVASSGSMFIEWSSNNGGNDPGWEASWSTVAPISPTVQWRMDELLWNGTANEVVDSIGGFNGTAFNATTTSGQVCNAGDFSANSTTDYVSLDAAALNGATDFTISVWAKTSNTGNQAIFSGSSGSQHNELIMWFPNATTFIPYIKGDGSGSISISNIADNNWHHIVWTRSGTQNCLYIDGVLQGCSTKSTQALSIANGGLIIGQEQDSLGGGFSGSQDWEGLIDEPLIFSQAITLADITSIYNNQLAGDEWDGSARTCPVVAVSPPPRADWRFDENSWNGTAGEVTDSSGNNYNGTAINASPVTGFICNAADLSANSNNDYLSMSNGALNGVGDFTLSVWGRTSAATTFATLVSAAAGNSGLLANELYMLFDGVTAFRPGISATFFTDTPAITTPAINDNQWHHYVWTRQASTRQSCLYRDGVLLGCITNPAADDSDPLTIASGGLILGQDQDSVGGGFDSAQDWEGLMDEVLIFDSVLSGAQISQGYSNQLVGNNWDGTSRSCNLIPRAEWRLDESTWAGVPGEVIDSSVNNFHGVALNTLPTPGQVCNAADLSANSTTDYLSLDAASLNGVNDFTLSVWGKTSNTGSQAIFSGSSGSQHNELIMWFPNATTFTPYIKGSGSGSISIPNIADNNWHHFIWTRSGSQNCIYVDGVLRGCSTKSTSSLSIANGGLIIGQEQDSLGGGFSSGQDWEGLIDEPLVFTQAVDQTQVTSIYNNQLAGNGWDGSPRSCSSSTLDHFDINTGGATGSVCLPQQITIRACADASCTNLVTNYTGTIGLSTLSNVGDWAVSTGAGTLAPNPDNDNNGAVDYTYNTSDGGSVVISLTHLLAASITITATDGGSATDTSSAIQFNENAFLIEDIDSLPGTDVPVAGRDHQYRATMIARTNSASPQCSVVTSYTGSQDLKGWVNRTGSDPGGVAPTIGAVSLPNSAPGADNLTVTFTAGITIFNLSTSDVGQYSVNLQEDSVVIPTIPPTNVPVSVTGSSNTATVRPFGLDIDFSGQRATDWLDDGVINDSTGSNTSFAQNQNGTAFVSAGANFSATARGVLWQTIDDNNVVGGDGVPDTGANLTDNAAAASFGQEGETVTLTHTLVLPAGGSNGSLTGGLVNSFTNGVGTTNLAWDEVGVIDLAANLTDNDYLGSGVDVSGVVEDVGRFTPDHFVLSAGSITEACVPGAGTPFTYLGQNLSGQFTLTAENTGNNTTTNYRGVFVKLDGASGTLDYDAVDGATLLAATPSDKSGTAFSWGNGVGTLNFTLSVDKGLTPAGPFNASIGVDPEDADLVRLLTGGFDLDTNPGVVGNEHALIGASNQRFGRIRGVGAFGPETQALPVPILAEYYDGSNFVTNVDDACTTLVAANFDLNVVDDDSSPDNSNDPAAGVIVGLVIDAGTSSGSIGNSPFITGDAGFSFSAPGTANTSKIEINLDLDALINPLPWLKYDWLNGGSETNPPQFDAVFGRYRGNDRIIYWREVFN